MGLISTVFKQKSERIVSQHTGAAQDNWHAPLPGEQLYRAHGPTFNAPLQVNWSGIQYWQTWLNNMYPREHRPMIQRGGSDSTALYLLQRNTGVTIAAAPIAIQQYALNQYQTYNGAGVVPNG